MPVLQELKTLFIQGLIGCLAAILCRLRNNRNNNNQETIETPSATPPPIEETPPAGEVYEIEAEVET